MLYWRSAKLRHAAKSWQHSAGRDGSLQTRLGYTTAKAPSEDPPAKPSNGPNMRTCCASEWVRYSKRIFCLNLPDSRQACKLPIRKPIHESGSKRRAR